MADSTISFDMEKFLDRDLSYSVVGAAIEVHKVLGPGFPEGVYEQALAHELSLRQIPFKRQTPILLKYKDITDGNFRTDFIVDDKIILEIKAITGLTGAHESQVHHYLRATGLSLAILLNFGADSLQIKRIIR